MGADTIIPSIEELILAGDDAPLRAHTALANQLSRQLYASTAPLLLLTREEVKNLRQVGGWGLEQVESALTEHGLRLRSSDETLIERAVALFGSIEAMPLAVLCLKIQERHGDEVVIGTYASSALIWMPMVCPNATVGQLLDTGEVPFPRVSTRDRVREFIADYGTPPRMPEPDYTDTANELVKLMAYWVERR